MKIYTRTGDDGTTSLVGGTRVAKCSPRLEAYGTVDELNSHIGLLLAMDGVPEHTRAALTRVQHLLFNLGAQLATEPESRWQPQGITDGDVGMVERAIDAETGELPPFRGFILPSGTAAAAQAHVARTVARRAERRMCAMTDAGIDVPPAAMRFVNRLSDYLFVAARYINLKAGCDETLWKSDRP